MVLEGPTITLVFPPFEVMPCRLENICLQQEIKQLKAALQYCCSMAGLEMTDVLNRFRYKCTSSNQVLIDPVWHSGPLRRCLGGFLSARDLVVCATSCKTFTALWDDCARANAATLGWAAVDDADCELYETGCVSWKQRLYYVEEPRRWLSWSSRKERENPQGWTYSDVMNWTPWQMVINFALGVGAEFFVPDTACEDRNWSVCRVMRSRGADFRNGLVTWNKNMPTSVGFLKWLVEEAKADPNAETFFGESGLRGPILYDIVRYDDSSEYAEVLPYLCQVTDLQRFTRQEPIRKTVLHLACAAANIPAIVELLVAGAKIRRNSGGWRPKLARRYRDTLKMGLKARAFSTPEVIDELSWT